MKMRFVNKHVALLCLLLAMGLAVPANADSFIKMATHTDAMEMMGQKVPAQDDTSSVWMRGGSSCSITPDGKRYLYNHAEGMIYMIDPSTKTYAKMSMNVEDMIKEAEEEISDEEAQQAKAMAEAMMGQMEITVTPTGESKNIKGWNTTKYIMDMSMAMGNTKTELWATEDIKIDYDAFKSVTNSKMLMMPGFEDVLEEWKKVKGLAVYSVTETSMMGTTARTTMEVLEYADEDAPAGTFDVPEGYNQVDMMEMQMRMGQ